jgi:tetratricopeptide (TPR) repeat protein
MPFGRKVDPASGASLDFDAIYRDMIKPAIAAAGLEPVRADEEMAAGIIHKPMFERLILCEFAVADLTTANANVYYELGVRHAVRPRSTVQVFAAGTRLPFDAGPLRGMPYAVTAQGAPADAGSDADQLTALLRYAREQASSTDSPIFQLVDGLEAPDISRLKTDVFRERVDYSAHQKERLAEARRQGADALRALRDDLGPIADLEAGVAIDLMLSFRAVKAWKEMIETAEAMPEPVSRMALVQEQYAFALNRAGDGEMAEQVLLELIESRGPSSETNGILGRVYKDRWQAARDAGRAIQARGLLKKAIEAYLCGFETDWRDAYPGVNAVTLMELADPPDPRRDELLPVVSYAVKRRIAAGEPDYWDHATLLELAVLARDRDAAAEALGDALAAVRETWEPETTLRNLRLIREAREARGEDEGWLGEVEEALAEAASPSANP